MILANEFVFAVITRHLLAQDIPRTNQFIRLLGVVAVNMPLHIPLGGRSGVAVLDGAHAGLGIDRGLSAVAAGADWTTMMGERSQFDVWL